MSFAVCVIPVSPLRREPSHRSEMVSQLLFGESCIILEREKEQWVKIKGEYDGYEGWCQPMHILEIPPESYAGKRSTLTGNVMNEIRFKGMSMQLPLGSSIVSDEQDKPILPIECKGQLWQPSNTPRDENTIRFIAFLFLNTGYLWGGKSNFGIDCSGYTQTVYKFLNIPLLRDAYQQAGQGEAVGFLQEARCGDLAFFDNQEGKITHVGILLNDHEIIHSSAMVRVDGIDALGIINRDSGERTHKLRIIKRYF